MKIICKSVKYKKVTKQINQAASELFNILKLYDGDIVA